MSIDATRFSNSWFEDVHAADKPYLVGKNVIAGQVNQSESGWYLTTGSNQTDSSVVTNAQRRLYDGFGNLSVGTTAAGSTYQLRLESTSAITLDTATVIGHNFADLTVVGTLQATLYAYDGTTTTQIGDTINVTGDRLTWTHLYDAAGKQSYPETVTITPVSTIARVYVSLTNVNPGSAIKPSAGEFWIGSRQALKHAPNLPYDDKAESGLVSDFQAQSGLTERYVSDTEDERLESSRSRSPTRPSSHKSRRLSMTRRTSRNRSYGSKTRAPTRRLTLCSRNLRRSPSRFKDPLSGSSV
jgi:hypothetical protein